ncbi:membrane integrity-associated transporter subunit PqiC [Oceanibaculum nanhaiense]|uniref:PqiC family protein n=1 Tax=Oceanibaculum nanhaiense TaxID=1909734 RepID=UPI00396DC2D8
MAQPAPFFLLLLSAVLLLAGCTNGPRADPRVIVLHSAAAAVPAAENRMGRIEVAEYLQRRHLIWRMSETQLVERRDQFWGERIEAGIRRVLEAELAVLSPSLPAGARYDVRIDRFEPGPDGRVALWAGWQLAAGEDSVLRSGQFQGTEAVAVLPGSAGGNAGASPEAGDAASVAAAMSRLLGQLAREMAAR